MRLLRGMLEVKTIAQRAANGLMSGFRTLAEDYLEGQGDLVSRLNMGISRVTIWVIRVINLFSKSP